MEENFKLNFNLKHYFATSLSGLLQYIPDKIIWLLLNQWNHTFQKSDHLRGKDFNLKNTIFFSIAIFGNFSA